MARAVQARVMGMRLNRLLGKPEALDAGQWTCETESGLPVVCCPGCSNTVELATSYLIDCDGRVAPAWACRNCAFFEYIQICDYREPVLK
jgi:hypothetical protein